MLAHHAAECAGAQDPLAFWRLHDVLFERQSELWQADVAKLTDIASELGLDAGAFSACMDDGAVAEKVSRMDQDRRDRGIRLRPSFEVNERRIEGAIPYTVFQQVFQEVGIAD
jgi:protein-disulfide isomerase